LRWERRQATSRVGLQAIGRTTGDLIAAVQVDDSVLAGRDPQALIGAIVEVEITAAAPLLLQARMV
jgi:hypothetical protein